VFSCEQGTPVNLASPDQIFPVNKHGLHERGAKSQFRCHSWIAAFRRQLCSTSKFTECPGAACERWAPESSRAKPLLAGWRFRSRYSSCGELRQVAGVLFGKERRAAEEARTMQSTEMDEDVEGPTEVNTTKASHLVKACHPPPPPPHLNRTMFPSPRCITPTIPTPHFFWLRC